MKRIVIQLAVGFVVLAVLNNCGVADPSADEFGTSEAPLVVGNTLTCGDAKKALVCHRPPGNWRMAHTLCIGQPAVAPHLSHHHDAVGACGAFDGGQPAHGDDGDGRTGHDGEHDCSHDGGIGDLPHTWPPQPEVDAGIF